MRISLNARARSFILRITFTLLIAVITFPSIVFADDADRELLNQLYREIVTSSAGKAVSDDTSIGTPSTNTTEAPEGTPVPAIADPAREQLQREISRMMYDTKARHDDAVRFMQDTQ